jgi:hypothetical protein
VEKIGDLKMHQHTDFSIEPLSLRFENHERMRYYKVILGPDLFGDWVLTKVWGGLGKADGRIMHIPCSYENAKKEIAAITQTRIKHGYQICCQ